VYGNKEYDLQKWYKVHIIFRSIPLNENPRLLPLILQGNHGGLHEMRFRLTFPIWFHAHERHNVINCRVFI